MIRFILLSLCLFTSTVFAQSLEDAQRAMSAGQYEKALDALNKHLARQPQDADARFQKGLALTALERDDDAIKVFADLARDFPELPEPYNNLAVLYARAGQYEEARDALEAALVSHPSYGTAHENLGDIYAAMAKASYNRAVVLDKNNVALQNKLALLTQLDPQSASGAPAVAYVPPVQAAPVAAATPAPVAAATAAPAPVAKASPAPQVATASAPYATPGLPPSRPAPLALPAAQPAPYVAPSVGIGGNEPLVRGGTASETASSSKAPEESAIMGTVNAWAAAWSAQNVDMYLATYSPNFEPATGISRAEWEAQRRSRVVRPNSVSVQVLKPSVFQGTSTFARVDFLQFYESDTYSDQVRKQLELEKIDGKWLIVSERVTN